MKTGFIKWTAILATLLAGAIASRAASTNVFTGLHTDLAIGGAGYFVVKDPIIGRLETTRNGEFVVDANGYLTLLNGLRVQGFIDNTFSTLGDLSITTKGGSPGIYISDFQILTNGIIKVLYSDASTNIAGQILLQNFLNPAALHQVDNRLYVWDNDSVPFAQPVAPGILGTGVLLIGTLEIPIPQLSLGRYIGRATNFVQGILTPTGIPGDLAIEGDGFFVLRRTNDNALFATRAGAFYLDGENYLTHYSGLRLQGYNEPSLSIVGDVQIDGSGFYLESSNQLFRNFSIDHTGEIKVQLADGDIFVRGEILLQSCSHPDLLTKTNFDLYPITTNAGLWSPLSAPATDGLGWIVSGSLEQSQLDASLVSTRSNINFFEQGEMVFTGISANLAIVGLGFFTVRDPVSNIFYATRLGEFQPDSLGYFVTPDGLRLQGMDDTNLMHYGDVRLDSGGNSIATLTGYSISYDGRISVQLSDGTSFVRGQVLLQIYHDLQALEPATNLLYSNVTAALPVFTNGLSGYTSLGTIQSGSLELPAEIPAPIQLPPVPSFRLLVTNFIGVVTVEASSDLIHWKTIGQLTASDLNSAEFFEAPQSGPRYYRVVTLH